MRKESALQFPCEFALKIFGVANDQFEINAISIVRKHIKELADTAIQSRPSKDGKYLALTITIRAESQKQLDDIYYDLTASPYILMAL